MAAGGPPMIWSYFLAAFGQFIVCLTFCEVVSQFPISGGLYPWARRLVGKRWAWMAGWIYGWALFTSIAAVAAGAAPFLAPLLGFGATSGITTTVAVAIVLLSTLINLAGTKFLARAAMFGFVCEIVGAIAVGGYLLIFQRHQSFGVVFDSFNVAHDGNYVPAFLAAAVVGLFTCYGFEACGDVAEETPNPGLGIPKAMRTTIYVGMSASVFVCLALILALPDIAKVVSGGLTNPIETILMTAFGPVGSRLVVVVVMVSFISCILSLQAAASRLVFAYARDEMVVGSAWLNKLSPRTHVPTRALGLSGAIACGILLLGLFFQDAVATIVSFAVIGIYAAAFPELVSRIANAGHTICHHSMTHQQPFNRLSVGRLAEEIERPMPILEKATGIRPRLFRPPGGAWSPQIAEAVAANELTPIDWSIDPKDWTKPGSPTIITRMLAATAGDIVLCHDSGGDRSQTVRALGTVIPTLLQRGLTFVPLSVR